MYHVAFCGRHGSFVGLGASHRPAVALFQDESVHLRVSFRHPSASLMRFIARPRGRVWRRVPIFRTLWRSMQSFCLALCPFRIRFWLSCRSSPGECLEAVPVRVWRGYTWRACRLAF